MERSSRFFSDVRLYNPNLDAMTTVLILGVSVYSGFIAAQKEHMMTKHIILRLRYFLIISGLAVVAAAMVFALGLPGMLRFFFLLGLTAIAKASMILVWITYRRSENDLKTHQQIERERERVRVQSLSLAGAE
jgi:hypothetical protein